MDKTLKVKGMHCNACATLVKMELEEQAIIDQVSKIEIDEEGEFGQVFLKNVSEVDLEKAINTINSMEQYQVVA